MSAIKHDYDVVIIGGGPGGSTTASMLRKYNPELRVLILEREKFPREHVGESQLPPISTILNEIGAWDKVEAAGFPIKIGATYRWGTTDDLWDFELFPAKEFRDEPRPAQFRGQRKSTAFQVERAVYDEILLDHAESMGTEVRQQTRVTKIHRDGDSVTSVELENGDQITSRYFIDASGHSGILRRAMDVPTYEPSMLRNVAFWDYWEDADWAFSVGSGGTRVQVMSLGYGWIWFIPVNKTKTSIGLVCPADYYKQQGLKPSEIYHKAVREDPMIRGLIKDAKSIGPVLSTKDWSFVSQRMIGENWMLVGESAGFADPILAAGMTLAQVGARDAACTILEFDRGELDGDWLREQYESTQRTRLEQHIKFADFWYSANAHFTDLKEFTREIAKDAGLELTANEAFQWLGTGGFVTEHVGTGIAGFNLHAVKDSIQIMLNEKPELEIRKYNVLRMNLEGAELKEFAAYSKGRIEKIQFYTRDGKELPKIGIYWVLNQLVAHHGRIDYVIDNGVDSILKKGVQPSAAGAIEMIVRHLEAMLRGGWITATHDPTLPTLSYDLPEFQAGVQPNRDTPYPSPASR